MLAISGIFNTNNIIGKEIKKKKYINNYNQNFKSITKSNLAIDYMDYEYNKCFFKIGKNNFCIVVGDIFEEQVVENKISKSEYLYNIFKFKGLEDVNKINGSYLFLIYEKNTLYIGKEQNSIIPCYYYFNEKNFIFSNDLKKILNFDLSKNINLTNIFTPILCGGIYLDNTTFYKNIFKLEPGTYVKISNQKISLKKFTYFSFFENSDKGLEYYIDNSVNILENAIKVRAKKFSKIQLGLSGGLDSRIMLSLIKRNFLDVDTFTYGTGQFVENDIAKKIAKISGVKHKYINIPKNLYLCKSNNSLMESNAILTTNMSPQINLFNNLYKKNSCLIFGTFLDYLIGNSGYQNNILKIRKISDLKKYYLNGHVIKYKRNDFLNFFSSKKIGNQIYDNIVSKVLYSLDKIKYDNIPNLNNSFFFSNRGKRWHNNTLLPVLIKNHVIIPNYDKNFLEFISKIPTKYKKNDYFRLKFLERINYKLSLVKSNKSMISGKITPYKNELFIKKQQNKIFKLRKKWINSKFNNKYSIEKYYDANFSEWISKFKNFNNFFKKRLFDYGPLKDTLNVGHIRDLFNKQSIGKIDNFKFFLYIADYQQYLRNIKKK